jgi:aryl-alcohol dehydrogenase-like predicted oxidoreductase
MEHRALGCTGVSVSKLCLGAMMFGAWGNPDHDESIRIIHRALDAGINFIDTADVYSAGESEEIVGKALAGGKRDDVVLATKFWGQMGDDPNRRGVSRRWIIHEVENSLRRLNTDWIDLYQVHRLEPGVDLEETVGALTHLVQEGKVRYIGSSTFPASAIVEAQCVARDRRLARYVTEQPPYSILVRGIEADVLPTCAKYGMGVIPAAGCRAATARTPTCRRRPPPHASGSPTATTSRSPPTSASSTPPTISRNSPTRPGSRSSNWRSPSSPTTPPSPRRSSARAPWSNWRVSSRRQTSSWTRRYSTASTRSSHPAPTSTPPTAGGRTPPWRRRRGGNRPSLTIAVRNGLAGTSAARLPR